MSLKRLAVAVMVSVCVFATHATAQKNELSGLVGRNFISDQAITGSTLSDNKLRFGNGLSFEVNYARRVMNAGLLSSRLKSRSYSIPTKTCTLQQPIECRRATDPTS